LKKRKKEKNSNKRDVGANINSFDFEDINKNDEDK